MRFGVRNRQEMQKFKKCEKNSVSGDSQEILVDLEMWQKMLKWPFLVVLSIRRIYIIYSSSVPRLNLTGVCMHINTSNIADGDPM